LPKNEEGRDTIDALGECIFTAMERLDPTGATWSGMPDHEREFYVETARQLVDAPGFFLGALAEHNAVLRHSLKVLEAPQVRKDVDVGDHQYPAFFA
jgi:hypothetical protein